MNGNFVEAQGLLKKYGALMAVNKVDIGVRQGEIFGLLGPNGAGKSTTLEIIEGLRTADEGQVTVGSFDVHRQYDQAIHLMGIQLQSTALMDLLTVRETLELFGSFYDRQQPVEKLLAEFELTDKRDARIKGLSGGQKQRLAIALALVHDPEVVILDEPTTGLDPALRRGLWEIIQNLKAQGKTVILSTHYMEEAETLCDRVAIMNFGQVVALDTPANLIHRLGSDNAPSWLQPLIKIIPVTHLANGLRKVMNEGAGFASISTNLYVLGAWLVFTVLIASIKAKWD